MDHVFLDKGPWRDLHQQNARERAHLATALKGSSSLIAFATRLPRQANHGHTHHLWIAICIFICRSYNSNTWAVDAPIVLTFFLIDFALVVFSILSFFLLDLFPGAFPNQVQRRQSDNSEHPRSIYTINEQHWYPCLVSTILVTVRRQSQVRCECGSFELLCQIHGKGEFWLDV